MIGLFLGIFRFSNVFETKKLYVTLHLAISVIIGLFDTLILAFILPILNLYIKGVKSLSIKLLDYDFLFSRMEILVTYIIILLIYFGLKIYRLYHVSKLSHLIGYKVSKNLLEKFSRIEYAEFVNIVTNAVLFTLTFAGVKRVNLDGSPTSPLFTIPANTQLGIRVGSGSINRPHIYFYSSAAT